VTTPDRCKVILISDDGSSSRCPKDAADDGDGKHLCLAHRMTALINGADSATPGSPLPAGTRILAAYVGLPGTTDATHVWTRDEWNLYLDPDSKLYGGPELRVLPIFVHDFPGDPVALANDACNAAEALGWSHKLGRLLCVDLETLVDDAYVTGLNRAISQHGFKMMKYGSPSTINQNPPVHGGSWMALLQARRPSLLPAGTVGDQWQWGTWDLSVWSPFVYENCGRGMRK
jgi:hypothetical protein